MRRVGLIALLFTIAGCDVFLDDFAVKYLIGQLDAHANHVANISFSPDGSRLASSDGRGFIVLWDMEKKDVIKEIVLSDPDYMIKDYHWPVLEFVSDLLVVQYFGQYTEGAFVPPELGAIKFYSADDGRQINVAGLPTGVSFDKMTVLNGELVVGERGPTTDPSYALSFYQISSGQVSKTDEWPVDGMVNFLAGASDGSRLAASIQDRQGVEVLDEFLKVFKADDGAELFSRSLPTGQDGQAIRMLALSADGVRLAYCPFPSGRVVVWEVDEERKDVVSEGGTEGEPCFLTFSPDGKWLAVNTFKTHMYRGNDMTPSVSIPIDHFWSGSIAFSFDSRTMAVGVSEKIRLWNVTHMKQ